MGPVRYSISEELHLAFWKLQFASSLFRGLAILTGLVAILGLIAFLFDDAIAALSVVIGGVISATLVIAFSRFVVLPWQAKRAWADYVLIKEHVDLTLDDEGFSLVQPSAHVNGKWSQIVLWNERDELFAMYLNSQLAYILPKDQIDKAIINFARERLIAAGLVKKGKRRK